MLHRPRWRGTRLVSERGSVRVRRAASARRRRWSAPCKGGSSVQVRGRAPCGYGVTGAQWPSKPLVSVRIRVSALWTRSRTVRHLLDMQVGVGSNPTSSTSHNGERAGRRHPLHGSTAEFESLVLHFPLCRRGPTAGRRSYTPIAAGSTPVSGTPCSGMQSGRAGRLSSVA